MSFTLLLSCVILMTLRCVRAPKKLIPLVKQSITEKPLGCAHNSCLIVHQFWKSCLLFRTSASFSGTGRQHLQLCGQALPGLGRVQVHDNRAAPPAIFYIKNWQLGSERAVGAYPLLCINQTIPFAIRNRCCQCMIHAISLEITAAVLA